MSHDDRFMWEDPEESPALRQLLRAGRGGASDYDVESGLARHLANVQAGAPLPAWATVAVQKGAASSLLAWLLPPIIGAGVLGAWLWIRPTDPTPATLQAVATADATAKRPELALAPMGTRPRELAVPTASTDVATPMHAPVSARAPFVIATRSASAPVLRALGKPVQLARVSAHAGRRDHAHLRREADDVDTRAGDSAPVEFANTSFVVPAVSNVSAPARAEQAPAAETEAARPALDQRAQADAPAKPAVRPQSDSKLEREMQMLAVAQRVLVDDPSRSLRLARQGEQEFRGSMFSAERKQVSLLALVQLGRLEEARRLGQPFLRAYPNAPWSARLREALSNGRLPAP
jgi:hypothetical protein